MILNSLTTSMWTKRAYGKHMQPDSLLSHIPSDHGSTLPVAQSIEPLGVTEHGFLNEQKLSKLTTYALYIHTPLSLPYKHMYTMLSLPALSGTSVLDGHRSATNFNSALSILLL